MHVERRIWRFKKINELQRHGAAVLPENVRKNHAFCRGWGGLHKAKAYFISA